MTTTMRMLVISFSTALRNWVTEQPRPFGAPNLVTIILGK
jgi:hypothetical protein